MLQHKKRIVSAIALILLFSALLSTAAGSTPYGEYNTTHEGRAVGEYLYPEVLRLHFDKKSEGVDIKSPTLEKMASSLWPRTSQLPGELAEITTHEEMSSFIDDLPQTYLRVLSLGDFPLYVNHAETPDDWLDLPLLIFSNPPTHDAEILASYKKPLVYLQGSIHGDEPSGAEALLALSSKLAVNAEGILDWVSVLILPRVNVDGAWHLERRSFGEERNYGSLDLNRDSIATLSPITRAIRNLLRVYRPTVAADFHEMGFAPSECYEYAGSMPLSGYRYYWDFDIASLVAHPANVDSGITELAYRLESAVRESIEAAGLKAATYIHEAVDLPTSATRYKSARVMLPDGRVVKGAATYPDSWREGFPDECIFDSAAALAPAMTLLFEARSPGVLTNIKTRVYSHYLAASSLLQYTAARGDEFTAAVNEAERNFRYDRQNGTITLWSKQSAEEDGELSFFELAARKDRFAPVTLPIKNIYRNRGLTSVLAVGKPMAYVISADRAAADAIGYKLALAGAEVKAAKTPIICEAESYVITSIADGRDPSLSCETRGSDYFPHSFLDFAVASVDRSQRQVFFPTGTRYFELDHPGAILAALAVEPLANRNLGNYWCTLAAAGRPTEGFIETREDAEYPVYRLMNGSPPEGVPLHYEAPLLSGAYVDHVRPFAAGTADFDFGYSFRPVFRQPDRESSLFSVTLPISRGGKLERWQIYDRHRDAFVPAGIEILSGRPTVPVGRENVDSDGYVRIGANHAPGHE